MKIVQVNNSDLLGRRFNGHDLQLTLNRIGHQAYQFVIEKLGDASTTIPICSRNELYTRSIIRNLEHQLSINNLLFPFGKSLLQHNLFKDADIVHYHLIHNHFLSLLDFPILTSAVPSVWTVHDPWVITGHCVHPLDCNRWNDSCYNCPRLNDHAFPMIVDKASDMWKIKRKIYQEIDIDIVVASKFMEDYIRNSPLTKHFKRIHKIPFGIKVEDFQKNDKQDARKRLNIPQDNFVISFRSEPNELKGVNYIFSMLKQLNTEKPITLLTTGTKPLPAILTNKYHVVELGWQNELNTMYDFYSASNVFIMPSLAESFGLMAIEAMASGCPIIVFENTVLPEITFAPECGISVPYKNSDLLRTSVERLIKNPEECYWRGEKGKEIARKHYRYEDYVNHHIDLYEEILDRKKNN
jgi:glycosyltransferase involved in cell wall biosynthesis